MAILADNSYVLLEGSPVLFNDAVTRMYIFAVADMKTDSTQINIQVWQAGGDNFYADHTVTFTEAELEAFTGSGTGEYPQFKSVVEQAAKDYLEGITENAAVTFTIT